MADFEENVEEMVEMTREAAVGDRVRGFEIGGPGGPGGETGNNTAATAGNERDSSDRLGNVCGRRYVYY